MAAWPGCSWSVMQVSALIFSGGSTMSYVSFSQPSPTTIASPPKFGC